MSLPKFLLSNNADTPDDFYVVHTEYPRFILTVDSQEIEWMDDFDDIPESEGYNEVEKLMQASLDFFTAEMDIYSQMDDDSE